MKRAHCWIFIAQCLALASHSLLGQTWVSFDPFIPKAKENHATLVLKVERNGDTGKAGSISFASQPGADWAPGEYSPAQGALDFGPGELTKEIVVRWTDNTVIQWPRALEYFLSEPSPGHTLGAHSRIAFAIEDNEKPILIDPGFESTPGADGAVWDIALQPDGKILIAGDFTSYNGRPRTGLARLHPDGSLDENFNPKFGVDVSLNRLLALDDGKILAGGTFTQVDRHARRYLVLLNQEGSLQPSAFYLAFPHAYSALGGLDRQGTNIIAAVNTELKRFRPNGQIDSTFLSNEIGGFPRGLSVQPNGKILVYGAIPGVLQRYEKNGARDTSLDLQSSIEFDGYGGLAAVTQPDGKILFGGDFHFCDHARPRSLIRLTADGSIDPSFTPSGFTMERVSSIVLQPDGKILLAGAFFSVPPFEFFRFARLNADGSWDRSFVPGSTPAGEVWVLRRQPDGKTLIGGTFQELNGFPTHGIARIIPAADPRSSLIRLKPEAQITEGNVSPHVVVERLGYTGTTASGEISFAAATAEADRDFRPVTTSFSFEPGATEISVPAPLLDDGLVEGPESITVKLGNLKGSVGFSTEARLVVRDNETPILNDPLFHGPPELFSLDSMVVDEERRIYILGAFMDEEGMLRTRVARLWPDGQVDRSFAPDWTAPGEGKHKLALQPDNKLLLYGWRSLVGGTQGEIVRLLPDGARDTTFQFMPWTTAITALVVEKEGTLLVGGAQLSSEQSTLARLDYSGRIDPRFRGPSFTIHGVEALAKQPDGRILVAGIWTSHGIFRLNPEGALDASFTPVKFPERAYLKVMKVLPEGKIAVGGDFEWVNDKKCAGLVALHPDGSLDESFHPSFRGAQALELLPDGSLMVGGFGQLDSGSTIPGLARLNTDGSKNSMFQAGEGDWSIDALVIQEDTVIFNRFDIHGRKIGGLSRVSFNNSKLSGFQLEKAQATEFENAGALIVPIRRLGDTTAATSLKIIQTGGNAKAPEDYILDTTGALFAAFQTRAELGIRIVDDPRPEKDKETALVFSEPAGGELLLGENSFQLRIKDDDGRPGSLDHGFARLNSSAPHSPLAMAADGSLLYFTGSGLARLRPDGRHDYDFQFANMGRPRAVALQADGKMIVALRVVSIIFETNVLVRLQSNGAVDASFASEVDMPDFNANPPVLAVQPDGKILFSGEIFGPAENRQQKLTRLRANGAIDSSFAAAVPERIVKMSVDAEGRIFVATTFGVLRLRGDGSVDPGFQAEVVTGRIHEMTLQDDGKVLLGGQFTSIGGRKQRFAARLLSDGALDISFNTGTGPNDAVFAIAAQPDGKIILGGTFTEFGGYAVSGVVRVHTDGSFDQGWNMGAGFAVAPRAVTVSRLFLQTEGKLVVSGEFEAFNDLPWPNLVRLHTGWPPHFFRAERHGTQIELSLRGEPGESYTLQTSDGLGHWTDAQTVTAEEYVARFSPVNTTEARRFFRAKMKKRPLP